MTQPARGGFCSYLRVGLRETAASGRNLLIQVSGMGVTGSDLSKLWIRAFQLGACDAPSARDRLTLLQFSADGSDGGSVGARGSGEVAGAYPFALGCIADRTGPFRPEASL